MQTELHFGRIIALLVDVNQQIRTAYQLLTGRDTFKVKLNNNTIDVIYFNTRTVHYYYYFVK